MPGGAHLADHCAGRTLPAPNGRARFSDYGDPPIIGDNRLVTSKRPIPRPALRQLERFLWLGLAAACLPTLLLVARNGLAPTQRPLTFGLVFGLAFAAAYATIALAAGLVALLAGRVPLLRWAPRAALVAGAVAAALLAVARNRAAVLSLLGQAGPTRFSVLLPAAFGASVLALAALAFLPLSRQLWARLASLAAIVLCAVALWPPPAPRPADGASSSGVRMSGAPLLVLGLDGADWDWIEPLMARGDLPNLAALRARGAWGRLGTQKPTLSPSLWTTIATGRSPGRHGIRGFSVERIDGVTTPLPRLKPVRSLGFAELAAVMRRLRLIDSAPVSSDLRRVPAYWNVATRERSPVNVVDWWVTWPAETVEGAIVSERTYYRPLAAYQSDPALRLTWPPELLSEIAPLVMRREDVTLAEAQRFMDVTAAELDTMKRLPARERTLAAQFTYFYSLTETDRRVVLQLTREGAKRYGRPPDLLALFRLLDMICHTSLAHSELVDDHLDSRPEDVRRYGRAVSEAHRTIDRIVGELVAAFGADANVVIVSDHGFDLESSWPDWKQQYAHGQGAQGIFLAAGPAFRAGRVEGMTILDILPLLVELKGFPLADDLEGRPAEKSLGPLFVPSGPVRRIATYGERVAVVTPAGRTGTEAEQTDRLRALGYVDD
jgi:hypothetical protein